MRQQVILKMHNMCCIYSVCRCLDQLTRWWYMKLLHWSCVHEVMSRVWGRNVSIRSLYDNEQLWSRHWAHLGLRKKNAPCWLTMVIQVHEDTRSRQSPHFRNPSRLIGARSGVPCQQTPARSKRASRFCSDIFFDTEWSQYRDHTRERSPNPRCQA